MTIDEGRELAPSSQRFEELGATAGHAGNVVREQVGTIVEAAQTKAADVERRSKESAAATRQDATVTANRILELMRAAERELGDLRRSVSREADALRVVLGKAVVRSGPALGAGSRDALDSVATPFEGEIGPPPEEAEAGARGGEPPEAELADEPAEPAEEAAEPEAEAPAPEEGTEAPEAAEVEAEAPAEEEAAEEETAAEEQVAGEAAETEAAEAEAAEEALAEEAPPEEAAEAEVPPKETAEAGETWGTEPSGDALEAAISRAEEQSAAGPVAVTREARIADARRRVARKSDEELAEAYEIAVEARSEAERSGNAEQVEYWDMLVWATVAEAVDRPAFGQAGAGEESLSRRERKRRAKRLKRLTAARENALRAAQPSDQG